MIRVVIVDDEPLARWRIRNLLEETDGFKVVAEAENGDAALLAIDAHRPDLVFLDVQMPGLSGFDVIEAIGADAMPATVFVTAYDAYAVKAFEVQALDYMLKPFDSTRFSSVLERARSRLTAPKLSLGGLPTRPHLVARLNGRIHVIPLTAVQWITAAGNYAEVTADTGTFLLNESLASLEDRLPREAFARVHRSAIVRLDRIAGVRIGAHGDGVIRLSSGAQLRLSRRYRQAVDSFLGM
jgi:two-component system LytT family response regulator